MLRGVFFFVGAVLAFVFGAELQAQTPARSPSASPPATATPAPSPTPSSETLINLMTSADLQQGIQLLKSNYLNPEALNETELNRALLMGLMTRLGPGFMVLPARAPAAIVTKLHRDFSAVLHQPDLRELFLPDTIDPTPSASPKEYAAFLAAETIKWGALVRETGAKAD